MGMTKEKYEMLAKVFAVEVSGDGVSPMDAIYYNEGRLVLYARSYAIYAGGMHWADLKVVLKCVFQRFDGWKSKDGRIGAFTAVVEDAVTREEDEETGAPREVSTSLATLIQRGTVINILYDKYRDIGCICRAKNPGGEFNFQRTNLFAEYDIDGDSLLPEAKGSSLLGDVLGRAFSWLNSRSESDVNNGPESTDAPSQQSENEPDAGAGQKNPENPADAASQQSTNDLAGKTDSGNKEPEKDATGLTQEELDEIVAAAEAERQQGAGEAETAGTGDEADETEAWN